MHLQFASNHSFKTLKLYKCELESVLRVEYLQLEGRSAVRLTVKSYVGQLEGKCALRVKRGHDFSQY